LKETEYDYIDLKRERLNSNAGANSIPKFEILDNYLTMLSAEDWDYLYSIKRFNFRDDSQLFERIRLSILKGLGTLPN
jgi:hypothetical protein